MPNIKEAKCFEFTVQIPPPTHTNSFLYTLCLGKIDQGVPELWDYYFIFSHNQKEPELIDSYSGDFTYISLAILNAQKRQTTFWK